MKLKSSSRKEAKNVKNTNVEKLDPKQLKKIMGGADKKKETVVTGVDDKIADGLYN